MPLDPSEPRPQDPATRASDQSVRLLLECMPAILWSIDRDLVITSSLGAALRVLDLRPGQLVGSRLDEYLHGADPQGQSLAAHRRALAGEVVEYETEVHGRQWHTRIEPLRDESGAVVGALGLTIDITERKRLEAQLLEAQKLEAVGRLAGGVAHDFNNLVGIITGYSDFLLRALGADHPLRGDVEEIKKAGERAAALTRQLLAFGRRQALQPIELDLNDVVTSTTQALRPLLGENVRVVTALATDLGRIRADPGQLHQVLLNLLLNARDAMGGKGTITIRTEAVRPVEAEARALAAAAGGSFVRLEVTDEGTGMDAETQAHLFEPFFTTKPPGKGSGLGLSTTYGIVRQSGGRIAVDSAPGRGTTFRIYLPQVPGAAVPAAPPPPAGDAPVTPPRTPAS